MWRGYGPAHRDQERQRPCPPVVHFTNMRARSVLVISISRELEFVRNDLAELNQPAGYDIMKLVKWIDQVKADAADIIEIIGERDSLRDAIWNDGAGLANFSMQSFKGAGECVLCGDWTDHHTDPECPFVIERARREMIA